MAEKPKKCFAGMIIIGFQTGFPQEKIGNLNIDPHASPCCSFMASKVFSTPNTSLPGTGH